MCITLHAFSRACLEIACIRLALAFIFPKNAGRKRSVLQAKVELHYEFSHILIFMYEATKLLFLFEWLTVHHWLLPAFGYPWVERETL